MSKNGSPSKIRRKKSYELARDICYKHKGGEYRDSFNPFLEKTAEKERFKKFYEQARRQYHYFESLCDDMAKIYGEFRPDRL